MKSRKGMEAKITVIFPLVALGNEQKDLNAYFHSKINLFLNTQFYSHNKLLWIWGLDELRGFFVFIISLLMGHLTESMYLT